MSVISSKRKISKCQAVINAVELKEKIHDLCIRDLGIKNMETVVRKKYIYGNDPYENMPKYVLELHQSKQRLHFLSDELIANTRAAHRIKTTSVRKCELKLDYQERSVNNCEMLIGKIQDIVNFFWVDINIYKTYIQNIDIEIDMLKKWIQSTNKIKRELEK